MKSKAIVTSYLYEVAEAFGKLDLDSVELAIEAIRDANRVWIVGNGGSAATAMHFANDLQKICNLDVVCLPSLVPTITAYGNDNGWENMFSDAMEAFQNGDVLVAISCSGRSRNVLNAAKKARSGKVSAVVALTGNIENNPLTDIADVSINVPHDDIRVQEDVHLVICHAIAGAIRNAM